MDGLHLTADLHGCPDGHAVMTNADQLRMLCRSQVDAVGLQPVGELFHRFGGQGGITGVVLLAESHMAVHTWPELNAVTLDVYVCNVGADNTQRAHRLLEALIQAFGPAHIERHALQRGSVK